MSRDFPAFAPATRPGTYNISATTGSAGSAIPINAFLSIANGDSSPPHALVTNEGPNNAYVEFGGSGVQASLPSGSTAGSLCVVSGATLCLLIAGCSYAAAVTRTGTATVDITPGTGFSA